MAAKGKKKKKKSRKKTPKREERSKVEPWKPKAAAPPDRSDRKSTPASPDRTPSTQGQETIELSEEDREGEEGPPDEEEGGKLARGLARSRELISIPFRRAATRKTIDPSFWSETEEALISADAGVACATEIVQRARREIIKSGVRNLKGLKRVFQEQTVEMIDSFGEPPRIPPERPHLIFIVGVNGVGKTTTAAKMGFMLDRRNMNVLFAAADTFRAAGIEQMEMWANRVGLPVVRHQQGGDPAAVVYDAIESAIAREMDVVLVDTAGRLHTKKNLMEELAKMWRVADRQLPATPEAVLVVDATTGQNGVSQARIFNEALDIGSLALTKMDGSAKGGVVLAIGRELGIPVAYVGVGEGLEDLRPFDAEEYARALF